MSLSGGYSEITDFTEFTNNIFPPVIFDNTEITEFTN